MKRRIFIKCDGGFGNRYNALLSGLYLARVFDLEPQLIWPLNNVCMAGAGELLAGTWPLADEAELGPRDDFLNLLHFENAPGLSAGHWVHTMQDMNEVAALLDSSEQDILFSTSLIPAYFDLGIVAQVLNGMALKAEIDERAAAFVADQAQGPFIGLHLRRTDFKVDPQQDRAVEQMIAKAPGRRFFVCSDCQDTEARLQRFDNVFVYPKSQYVGKLVDGAWRQDFLGEDGKARRFNVLREADSVQQALVDLAILSRSEPVATSASTFLKTAMLMRAKSRRLLRFGDTYGQHFYV